MTKSSLTLTTEQSIKFKACYFQKENHGIMFKNNNFWLLLDSNADNQELNEADAPTIPVNMLSCLLENILRDRFE